eukprot:XP_011661142.1 PREDICTED: uncharacterized protein LOC105436832 [Strongylocentrotus purpuratus]
MANLERNSLKFGTGVASKTIDSRGGTIQLPYHGISLCIPVFALQQSCKITLKVLSQPSSVLFTEDEAIVSPGVVCEPSGTTFEKPLKLVIPHCAVLTDPSEAKVTMHFTNGDKKVINKNMSSTGTPRCVVGKDVFVVYIDSFSICEMFMVISDYLIGKRVASTPYLPNSMSCLQPQYCHLRLYNDTPGIEYFIETEEEKLGYRKIAPTRKNLFVLWKTGELRIRCEVDSGHVTENEKTVSLDDIYRLDRNVVDFLVKVTGDADVRFKINIHLHCNEEHAFDAKCSDGDKATNLQLPSTTTSKKPEGATSSSTKSSASSEGKAGVQLDQTRLPDSPTRLDDPLLYDIAQGIESDEHLDRLMHALEVTIGSQSRCHESNRLAGQVTTRGTYQMLSNWRAEIALIEQRSRLKDALTRAKLLDMRDRFFPG